MKYQTKPITVEAIQWKNNDDDLIVWARQRNSEIKHDFTYDCLRLRGPSMDLFLDPNDWLIWCDGAFDEFDTCGPVGFKNKYKECE